MAIYLICITTSGGLPIFTKNKGGCDNLPFSTVASMNGVHMFFKSLGMCLQTTFTDEWTILWKDFHNSITLILCGKQMTETKINLLADLVFSAFGLFISVADFEQLSIYDRMKREAKNYMPIVDQIIDSCDSEILEYNDCILTVENNHILSKLNEFSFQCCSLFCSLVINNKFAVGTEGWWDLHTIDRKLLSIMLSLVKDSQNDKAVYLPHKSPNIAYRIVAVPITANSTLCVICGAEPPCPEINIMAQYIFRHEINLLQNAECNIPRNFPETITFDPNILGILLLNKVTKKYVLSECLLHACAGKRVISGSHHSDILRIFFDQAIDGITEHITYSAKKSNKKLISAEEQYWCSEYHKCYSCSDDNGNLICVLFVASVPTHTMKLITQKTLSTILKEKNICW